MEWRTAVSEQADSSAALRECVDRIKSEGGEAPDIAFLFPSPHHARHFARLPEGLRSGLHPKAVIGCSGGGVIAGGKEVERRPGLGVLCGWLPGARVHTFALEQRDMPGPDAPPKAWRDWLGVKDRAAKPSFVIVSDPFTLDAEELARGLDFAFPASTKVGGLASAAAQPGGNALYLGGEVRREGAVGAWFDGNVALDPIVAQGCRAIGRPYRVTDCERNLLTGLDNAPVLEVLEALLEGLEERDQKLARTSLFLGVLNDPLSADGQGEYLIRNLVGLDPDRGVLAIGAHLRLGQTVQFHLRDKVASAHDLDERLSRYRTGAAATLPRGALLFQCLGRGEHLYGKPNHDSDLFKKRLGPLAVGGFFCNGELGPVEGATYLHGYTSCFGIFRPVEPETVG
jgi:small ligand-binding sensory domain FIST